MNLNTMVAWVAALVLVPAIWAAIYSMHRTNNQTAIRKALIDKIGSARDLAEVLQTPAGQRLFADLSSSGNLLHSVVGSVQRGVLALVVGAGVATIGRVATEGGLVGIGSLFMFLGVGFLISAAITYRLLKSWGLLAPKE